jgi:hypothetical protein
MNGRTANVGRRIAASRARLRRPAEPSSFRLNHTLGQISPFSVGLRTYCYPNWVDRGSPTGGRYHSVCSSLERRRLSRWRKRRAILSQPSIGALCSPRARSARRSSHLLRPQPGTAWCQNAVIQHQEGLEGAMAANALSRSIDSMTAPLPRLHHFCRASPRGIHGIRVGFEVASQGIDGQVNSLELCAKPFLRMDQQMTAKVLRAVPPPSRRRCSPTHYQVHRVPTLVSLRVWSFDNSHRLTCTLSVLDR